LDQSNSHSKPLAFRRFFFRNPQKQPDAKELKYALSEGKLLTFGAWYITHHKALIHLIRFSFQAAFYASTDI